MHLLGFSPVLQPISISNSKKAVDAFFMSKGNEANVKTAMFIFIYEVEKLNNKIMIYSELMMK